LSEVGVSAEINVEDIFSAAGDRVLEALEPNDFFSSFQIEVYDERVPNMQGGEKVGISYAAGTVKEPVILVNLDYFQEYCAKAKDENDAISKIAQLLILCLITAYYEGMTGSSRPMPVAHLRLAMERVIIPFETTGVVSFAKFPTEEEVEQRK